MSEQGCQAKRTIFRKHIGDVEGSGVYASLHWVGGCWELCQCQPPQASEPPKPPPERCGGTTSPAEKAEPEIARCLGGHSNFQLPYVTEAKDCSWFYVYCPLCRWSGPILPSRNQAILAWNEVMQPRKPEPLSAEDREALKDAAWILSDTDTAHVNVARLAVRLAERIEKGESRHD